MTTRLLLAAAVATGSTLAPAAFAQDAIKPAISKKTSKPTRVQKRSDRASSTARKQHEEPMQPYSTQKDEMTR